MKCSEIREWWRLYNIVNVLKVIYTVHFSIIKMVAFRVCEFYLNLKKNNPPLSHLEGIDLKQAVPPAREGWAEGTQKDFGRDGNSHCWVPLEGVCRAFTLAFGPEGWMRGTEGAKRAWLFHLSIRTGMILCLVGDLKCSARHSLLFGLDMKDHQFNPICARPFSEKPVAPPRLLGIQCPTWAGPSGLWEQPRAPWVLLWSRALSVSFLEAQPPQPSSEQEGKRGAEGVGMQARPGDGQGGRRQWLPRWLRGKEPAGQCRRPGFHPWVGKVPWRRKWQPTPVVSPEKSHGQRSLAGYSPWSHRVRHDWQHACMQQQRKESRKTEEKETSNGGLADLRQRFRPHKSPQRSWQIPSRRTPPPPTTCWKSLLREQHVDFGMTQIIIEHLFSQRA